MDDTSKKRHIYELIERGLARVPFVRPDAIADVVARFEEACSALDSASSKNADRVDQAPLTAAQTEEWRSHRVSKADTAAQIDTWLRVHAFPPSVRVVLRGFTGQDMLASSKQDLVQLLGAADGIRLYLRLYQHVPNLTPTPLEQDESKTDSGLLKQGELKQMEAGAAVTPGPVCALEGGERGPLDGSPMKALRMQELGTIEVGDEEDDERHLRSSRVREVPQSGPATIVKESWQQLAEQQASLLEILVAQAADRKSKERGDVHFGEDQGCQAAIKRPHDTNAGCVEGARAICKPRDCVVM